MTHSIRHIVQVAVSSLFLMFAGTTAAFAGPPPIEPGSPRSPASEAAESSDSGFPWMLTGAIALLAIAVVALSVVLWSRYHASHHRLATP